MSSSLHTWALSRSRRISEAWAARLNCRRFASTVIASRSCVAMLRFKHACGVATGATIRPKARTWVRVSVRGRAVVGLCNRSRSQG